jgi:hypothetical protein
VSYSLQAAFVLHIQTFQFVNFAGFYY